VLRKAGLLPLTTFEEVRGFLKYDGPPVTIEEMDEAIGKEARRMWVAFERQKR